METRQSIFLQGGIRTGSRFRQETREGMAKVGIIQTAITHTRVDTRAISLFTLYTTRNTPPDETGHMSRCTILINRVRVGSRIPHQRQHRLIRRLQLLRRTPNHWNAARRFKARRTLLAENEPRLRPQPSPWTLMFGRNCPLRPRIRLPQHLSLSRHSYRLLHRRVQRLSRLPHLHPRRLLSQFPLRSQLPAIKMQSKRNLLRNQLQSLSTRRFRKQKLPQRRQWHRSFAVCISPSPTPQCALEKLRRSKQVIRARSDGGYSTAAI